MWRASEGIGLGSDGNAFSCQRFRQICNGNRSARRGNVSRSLPKVCRNDLPRGANAVRPSISSEDPVHLRLPRSWRFRMGRCCFRAAPRGRAVASVKKASGALSAGAPSAKVTPYTLRHTAATWLMQRGAPIWETAGFLGLSSEVLQKVMATTIPTISSRQPGQSPKKGRFVSAVESVVDSGETNDQKKNPNESWSEWQDSNLRPLLPESSVLFLSH